MPRNKNEDLYKSIGKKLREKRKELKFSQEKVAEFLNVDYVQIYKYETGKTKIPIDYLLKLCEKFNVPIDHFIKGYKIGRKEKLAANKEEIDKISAIVGDLYKNKQNDLIASLNVFIKMTEEILRYRNKN